MPRAGSRVLDNGHLEAPFKQLPQVRFDAYVRQHPAENDLIDPPFAQLQHQIVDLRSPHFVRTDDDRLAIPIGRSSSRGTERRRLVIILFMGEFSAMAVRRKAQFDFGGEVGS